MKTTIIICLMILILIFCSCIMAVSYALLEFTKYLKNKDIVETQKMYKDIDVEKIDRLLESIIEREFNEYHKFHPELSQEGAYIKRDEINNIVTTITSKVYATITPAIKYNIGLIYDISTDEKLINLLGERVGVLVMAMAATINSTLIDDTPMTNIEI